MYRVIVVFLVLYYEQDDGSKRDPINEAIQCHQGKIS
jgi:hypothetical protein